MGWDCGTDVLSFRLVGNEIVRRRWSKKLQACGTQKCRFLIGPRKMTDVAVVFSTSSTKNRQSCLEAVVMTLSKNWWCVGQPHTNHQCLTWPMVTLAFLLLGVACSFQSNWAHESSADFLLFFFSTSLQFP